MPTKVEWSSCHRNHIPFEVESIYYLAFYQKCLPTGGLGSKVLSIHLSFHYSSCLILPSKPYVSMQKHAGVFQELWHVRQLSRFRAKPGLHILFCHQADLKISASVASLFKIILTHSYHLKLWLSLEKLGSAHPFLVSSKRQVDTSFCYKNFPKPFSCIL